MTIQKSLFNLAVILLLATTPTLAPAGDFDWLKELNIKAVNDGEGFRTRLAARFQIGRAQVDTIINNVQNPADAYMVLRLGELSGRHIDEVIQTYNADKNKGWGAMAKSLGIKPGSKDFHALKRGSDLQDDNDHESKKEKSKGKPADKEHGKDKNKNKNRD